jgi:hypothetical protein
MKLALITDPRGFPVVRQMEFSYHLVLAQYVREDPKYVDFYFERHQRGDFIMIDNGAAESVQLHVHELVQAARDIKADEIILPDVLGDKDATLGATLHDITRNAIPARMRAVCPQGNSIEEWIECLQIMKDSLEFATVCVPKHLERFEGGRRKVLEWLTDNYYQDFYNIHLLGVWGYPYKEMMALKPYTSVCRGIDTALPFALAQSQLYLDMHLEDHVSHKWGKKLDRSLALANAQTLWEWVWEYK